MAMAALSREKIWLLFLGKKTHCFDDFVQAIQEFGLQRKLLTRRDV